MFERIIRMVIKEFIQVFRDPRMKMVIFLAPLIELLLFGYAVTTDVRHITTGVYDLDNTVASRELVADFESSGYFDITERIDNDVRMQKLIDEGSVQTVLRINKGFESNLRGSNTANLQVIVDGTDSNTASVILNYAVSIAQKYSKGVLLSQVMRVDGTTHPPEGVELESRAWFNENLESRNFYVPGVIALIVTLITLMLTSMAIVREKEVGTMEQLMVTPIKPSEFILGKTLPFVLIGFADVMLIAFVGVMWFKVPIRGNPLLLFGITGLYLMTTLGVGLLISTISRTQQQAMMSTFFFFFPAVLLSGFVFPIANMPVVVQWITFINPLRYYLVVIRGIFLKGVGIDVLWPQAVVLGGMGVITLWTASKRFHKTIA